uniref:Uncharacterized protein n=1 Tax=Triticum urartu TaxID=4572 RepID=A0A8R7TPN0_TRIUA
MRGPRVAAILAIVRPGGGARYGGPRPAVRLAGRRRDVPELPLLQPLRLLWQHLRLLRRWLPEPVQRLRPHSSRTQPRRGRVVHHLQGHLPAVPAPQQPVHRCRRVLHVRRIPGRRRRVPGLRHHGEHRDAEAGGGGLLRADLPRDHRRVGHRPRWPLLLGLLLQAGAGLAARLLPAVVGVAVRARQAVLRPRPHHAVLELQLRPRGARHRRGPAQQPGPGGHGCHGVVRDGAMVLDDAAGKQAVLPRRDHGPVDANGR